MKKIFSFMLTICIICFFATTVFAEGRFVVVKTDGTVVSSNPNGIAINHSGEDTNQKSQDPAVNQPAQKTENKTITDKNPGKEKTEEKNNDQPIEITLKEPDTEEPGTPGKPGKPGTPDKFGRTLEELITSGFTLDLGQLGLRGQYVKDFVIPGTPDKPGTNGIGGKIIKGIDILIFGLTHGKPDITTVSTPEQIAQIEQQATYQEPIDLSGEWHDVIKVIRWEWNFHNITDSSVADANPSSPDLNYTHYYTATGTYRVTAKAWCLWEYGHYEADADGKGRHRVKDGEYEEYDLSKTRTFKDVIGWQDLNKPIQYPHQVQQTVKPVDELVE